MTDSSVTISKKHGLTAFAGRDAVHLYRANMLRASILLYLKSGIIPTRGVTITKMLAMAGGYTGKKYKRGQGEQAAQDLKVWTDNMALAMPIEVTE